MSAGTGFGFSSAEHFMAAALHDVQKAMQFVVRTGGTALKAEGTVEGITALLPNGNGALVLERAAFATLGLLVHAAMAADAAAAQDGLDLKVDAAMVAALRELVAGFRSELQALGYAL